MCDCRAIFARIEFVSQRIERVGILTEVGEVEYGFGIRKVQSGEIGI